MRIVKLHLCFTTDIALDIPWIGSRMRSRSPYVRHLEQVSKMRKRELSYDTAGFLRCSSGVGKYRVMLGEQ